MFPKNTPNAEAREIFDAEPARDPAMAMCLEAWSDLDSEREYGYGVIGPIRRSAIRAWCLDEKGLGRDETAIVLFVLRRLDADRAEALNSRR